MADRLYVSQISSFSANEYLYRSTNVHFLLCILRVVVLCPFSFRFGQTRLTQQSTGQTRSTNGTTVTLIWFRFMLGFKVRVNIC
ncbi:hypothetical protein Hanom_Chr17g01552961 [Helianthus anomalus]